MDDRIILRGGPLDGASFDRADLDRLARESELAGVHRFRFLTPDGRNGVYQKVNDEWVHVADSDLPPEFRRRGPR